MVINKSKVIIRPEKPSEYGEVNKLIYEAFTEQHGVETGKFMMEHFMEERKKQEKYINEKKLAHNKNSDICTPFTHVDGLSKFGRTSEENNVKRIRRTVFRRI